MKTKMTNLKRWGACLMLLAAVNATQAANTKETHSQITNATDIAAGVDFTITGATPFATSGSVNFTDTDHSVLILSGVKPSAAIQLLSHVTINGQAAVNNQNCQVKIYSQGSIIMPYDKDIQPLTVYSEQNFSGDECSDFGLEDAGGFMNTLTDEKLNNRIRSFRLKRGYMVTFSIRAGGYGYSRCFIADKEDLEVATLPTILDQKITSYRIFPWNDTSKKGVADAANDKAICSALNVTTTYEWWQGKADGMEPDVECVPHHYKESWPTPGMCGQGHYSPHLKTNNEPRNTSDEEPCELEAILNNWEALMATGKRLCSPSSWDGSDYWDGTGFIKSFIEAIDERGWRCDIVDLHCYWPKDNFGNLQNWFNTCKRPIWVSEWVWGASWGTNTASKGAFADGVTEEQNANVVKEICQKMNNMGFVERYYYWNAEADISKVYKNGQLTKAGEYYATMDPGVGYNKSYDYVPATPKQKAAVLSTITAAGKTTLKWNEYNGELNRSMVLQYRQASGSQWQAVATIEQKEDPAAYTYDTAMGAGDYRIYITSLSGTPLYSNVVTVGDNTAYYLYNIGAQKWLCSGSSWGTHAALTANGGIDVLIEEAGNGKYTIDTQLLNGEQHYLSVLDDNNPWMDQVKDRSSWEFEEVGQTDGGQPIYLMNSYGNHMAYDGQSISLVMSSEQGVNAQWLMQTRDDRMALLEGATADNPVDATFLIADHDFYRYDQRINVWQGGPSLDGHFTGTESNQVAEKYNTAFNVYQTISGAPQGDYRLLVQGFYRNGNIATAASRHQSGSEQLDAMVYVGDNEMPLMSIFDEAGKMSIGASTDGISGQFPDNRDQSAQWFLAGHYEQSMEFSLDSDEDFNIGIRKTSTTSSDWACFDNFRLIYLGGNPLTAISELRTEQPAAGIIYDLQGRRVQSIKNGLYIKDGKKIVARQR